MGEYKQGNLKKKKKKAFWHFDIGTFVVYFWVYLLEDQ